MLECKIAVVSFVGKIGEVGTEDSAALCVCVCRDGKEFLKIQAEFVEDDCG